MKAPRETDIVKACLQLLKLRGVFAWRQNSGAVSGTYKGKRRFFRMTGVEGVSDIIGVLPDGRFLAVEVKQPGGLLTAKQEWFLGTVKRMGGVGLCAFSVVDLQTKLKLVLDDMP